LGLYTLLPQLQHYLEAEGRRTCQVDQVWGSAEGPPVDLGQSHRIYYRELRIKRYRDTHQTQLPAIIFMMLFLDNVIGWRDDDIYTGMVMRSNDRYKGAV
jgi:hypothetical protein